MPAGFRLHVAFVAACAVIAAVASTASAAAPADVVLRNGYVYTANAHNTVAQALAVRKGRVVFVGSNRKVRAFVGKHTKVTDLIAGWPCRGSSMATCTPSQEARACSKCSLDYLPLTVEQIQTRIAKCLADTADKGPEAWLEVTSWYQEAMMPAGAKLTTADLDALSPTRPIIVTSSFFHATVVNSVVMRLAGITAATPTRRAVHRPRRRRQSDRAALRRRPGSRSSKVPPPTAADDVDSAKAALKAMRKQGITSFFDAAAGPDHLAAFRDGGEGRRLTARAHFAPVIYVEEASIRARSSRACARCDAYDQGAIRRRPSITLRNAKMFMDGVQQCAGPDGRAPQALPHQHGTADPPNWVPGPSRGPIYFPPAELNPLVTAIAARLRSARPRDRRPRCAPDPRRLRRLRKRIGQATSGPRSPIRDGRPGRLRALPEAGRHPDDVLPVGQARPGLDRRAEGLHRLRALTRVEPGRQLMKAGARIAYGSDWPVDTLNEWFALQVGITRAATPRAASTPAPSMTKGPAAKVRVAIDHRLARTSSTRTTPGRSRAASSPTHRARSQLLRSPRPDHEHQGAADDGGRPHRLPRGGFRPTSR